jgi:hypothetical protein
MATSHETIQKQLNQYLSGEKKITRTVVDMMFLRMTQANPELWMPAFLAYLSKGRTSAQDEVVAADVDPFDRGGKK